MTTEEVAGDKEAGANLYHLEADYMDDFGYDRFDLGRRYGPSIHLCTLYHEEQIGRGLREPDSMDSRKDHCRKQVIDCSTLFSYKTFSKAV